ncbi:Tyr recombinase domain-containing protein (Fragment) [Durusdinium trenchii]|uniref:Tyr recombinase domain-containing protein n=1 Tax=Durusdinium trenchii TaxID=1381693 RepID=A0ABP0PP09_9DINO
MAILRVVALMVAILGSRSVAERLLGKWQWSKSLLGWDGLLVAGRRINHKGVVFLMTRRQQLLPWCNGLTNPDLFLEQRPQAQSVELHPGDTAAMVGRPQLPTLPQRTMREVFQSALGTLTCDERMRSNMGGDEDGKQDLMPLPVPQADAVVAATVVAINHLGGLDTCAEHELQRWRQDSYRFPPYQYKDNHGLWSKKGSWRRPNVQERELIMGFPLDYTKNCVVKAEQKGRSYDDARLSLLGNSWQVGVVAWLIMYDNATSKFAQWLKDNDLTLPRKRDQLDGRGGAAFWFSKHGNLDKLMIAGRWQRRECTSMKDLQSLQNFTYPGPS